MSMTDKLKEIKLEQAAINDKLAKVIYDFDANDLVNENDKLRSELDKCKEELQQSLASNDELDNLNKSLKNTLYEQLYNEKISILNIVNRKIDSYYQAEIEGELNRLSEFEFRMRKRILEMVNTLKKSRVNSEDEIYKRIYELNKLLESKIYNITYELNNQKGAYSLSRDVDFEKLHEENLSEEEIKSALKKNNIESVIGLNVFNKIGILFLIIGIITFTQFVYFKLPDVFKSILLFSGGAVLLVIGELLSRKKPNVFSLGMTSAGIAVLNVALDLSFFGLKIIGDYPALIICIGITSLAFLLSIRYKSETVAIFAIVGGFIPIFTAAVSMSLIYSVMVYFIIMGIFALLLSYNKKWIILGYVGFSLNFIATCYIMFLLGFNKSIDSDGVLMLLYLFFISIIYTAIPILYNFRKKLNFKNTDIILLALNTVLSSFIMFIEFKNLQLADYMGLLSIFYAVIYIVLGKLVEIRLPNELKIRALFYLTAATFVVLTVPFQLDILWMSLGWLIEGVLVLSFGLFKEIKSFVKGGFIVCGFCLASFLFCNVISEFISADNLFVFKYFAVTLGSVIIIGSYALKKILMNEQIRFLKYCTVINVWLFMLYFMRFTLFTTLIDAFPTSYIDNTYLVSVIAILCSFIIAYFIPRIRPLCDNVMKQISLFIYSFGILWLFILNCVMTPSDPHITEVYAISTIILIVIGLLSVFALRDMMKSLALERKINIEWYPFAVSAYFVIILTQNLISFYDLAFNNFILSLIYIVTAFSWIVFGFVKRFSSTRRFGLGLSFLAIAKLFIIDLYSLTQGLRIISYFAFGITLIAISFIYQYFNKRLDLKAEVITDIKDAESNIEIVKTDDKIN